MNTRIEISKHTRTYNDRVQKITVTTETPVKLAGGTQCVKGVKPTRKATINDWILKMTVDQAKKLISNNDSLSNTLYEWVLEDANFWVGEYLDGARKALSWSVGGYYDDFVEIREDDTYYGCYRFHNFEAWFDDVQRKFALFSEIEEKTINRFLSAANLMYHLEYECTPKEKDYNRVLDKFERLKKESEQILLERLNSDYSYANTIEALIERLADSIRYNDFNAHELVKISDVKNALMA